MTEQLEAPVSPAPEAAKKKTEQPEYHVLQLTASSGAQETYEVRARNVKAASAKDAVKAAATPAEAPQSFVAIPSRSFKLHKVSLVTTRQTVIE